MSYFFCTATGTDGVSYEHASLLEKQRLQVGFLPSHYRKASLALPMTRQMEINFVLLLSFGDILHRPRRPRPSFLVCAVVMRAQASVLPHRYILRFAERVGSEPVSWFLGDPLPKTLSAGANDQIIWMGHSETHGGE